MMIICDLDKSFVYKTRIQLTFSWQLTRELYYIFSHLECRFKQISGNARDDNFLRFCG